MHNVNRAHLATIVRTLEPVANRLVFHGIATCRCLPEWQHELIRGHTCGGDDIRAVTTVPLNRLASELGTQVENRTRLVGGERWTFRDGTRTILSTASEAKDAGENLLLDYATLLTRQVDLPDGHPLRIVSPVVQLALCWRDHQQSGRAFIESAGVEDFVEIVSCRPPIAAEIAALPDDLRALVAHAMAAFCADEAASWVVARALPDARDCASVTAHVMQLLRDMARPAAG